MTHWLVAKTGEMTLVDPDVYTTLSKFVWRACKDGNRVLLYRNCRRRGQRKKVYLHRLITGALPGQSVHHKYGTVDCRRQSLIVYNSHEEHQQVEHTTDAYGGI